MLVQHLGEQIGVVQRVADSFSPSKAAISGGLVSSTWVTGLGIWLRTITSCRALSMMDFAEPGSI